MEFSKAIHRLKPVALSKLPAGLHHDGGGLYLSVSGKSARSWVYRFMVDGKARTLGLGPYPAVSLQRARHKAAQARSQKADGLDPIEQKRAARAAATIQATKNLTFGEVALQYIAAHRAGWSNLDHATQWESSLRRLALPTLGKLPVAAIDTDLVLSVLRPIWEKTPETANRVRGRIEAVLGYATAAKLRSGDNPATWSGHLEHLLAAKTDIVTVKHHPALRWQDVPAFVAKLSTCKRPAARVLEFQILTAARPGEARLARWDEIDLEGNLWTLSPDRMKGGLEHRVPLSPEAIAVLGKPGTGLVWTVGTTAVWKLQPPGATAHGFRSSFRDWASETTSAPHAVMEACLAHKIPSGTERAYARSDLLDRRRELMTAWATFCAKGV